MPQRDGPEMDRCKSVAVLRALVQGPIDDHMTWG